MKRFCLVWIAILLIGTMNADEKKLKALIVDGQNNHNWKGTTPILKKYLEQAGIFTVDVATTGRNTAKFNPKFSDYSVVVLNYNGADWPQKTQENFVDYMRNGGGLVVFHAANNSFPKWKEYNRIIGLGGWGGRNEKDGPYIRYRNGKVVRDSSPGRGGSHGRQHEYVVETINSKHPITKGLPEKWLHVRDELYDRLRGPAENLTVLSISYSDKATGGTGENEPVLFTIKYGKGRVFHTVMGDNVKQMDCVGFAVTLQRGTEWAATGKVTQKIPKKMPTAEKVLRASEVAKEDAPVKAVSLFNGKNLEGWYPDVPEADKKPDIRPSFIVRDGKLVSMGRPLGHLISKKSYKDYRLEVEYRFAGKPGNCGVLVHTDGKRPRVLYKMFPASLEVQMHHRAAGDFWCIDENIKVPNMEKRRRGPKENWGGKQGQSRHIRNLTDGSEKPLGEWNAMRIECLGDKIRVWVNGDLVNDGYECTASRGQISLQAEGAEVEFRKLLLTPIKKLTAAKNLPAVAQKDRELITWKTKKLSPHFYGEGAYYGDFNKDGRVDVVSGPFWYQGPDFSKKHEYRPAKQYKPEGYSDNFLTFVHDFNRDGWDDILIIGWPGYKKDHEHVWYENTKGKGGMWPRHDVFKEVDNESPVLGNLVGDQQPELIFHSKGHLGWAAPDPKDPTKPWTFHKISKNLKLHRYAHGLGFGDINGDGRADFIQSKGWWEQPKSLEGDSEWTHHAWPFRLNGSQMLVYDVDGDGDNDIVTAIEAHKFGIAWLENSKSDAGKITFKMHRFINAKPEENRYGVKFSQPHAMKATDFNGDGLTDFVVGKRFWAHGPKGDPEPNAAAVTYWFELKRGVKGLPGGVDFVPHLIHDDSGVGTQVAAGDINGDGLPDVISGNKKGTHIHLQVRKKVSEKEWKAAQPKVLKKE